MEAAAGGSERLLAFTLAGRRLAVPLAAVGEVLRAPAQLTRVPGAPAAVRGAMARRGEVIPVIQLDAGPCPWVAVLRLDAGRLGLALAAAPTTLSVAAGRLQPTRTASPLVSRRAALDEGGWLSVLDPGARGLSLSVVAAALAEVETA